jgi:hypothetical protein
MREIELRSVLPDASDASGAGERGLLDWKGPASIDRGYKHREELSVRVLDTGLLLTRLDRLGYGIPREGFTVDRLSAFILSYEARTRCRAAISDREASGEYRYALDDV